jgi:transposase InsO family protein
VEGICAEYEEWPIKKITTDQGTIFQSRKWGEKLEENNIRWQRTSVYHPESDGLAKRYVQTISEKLRCRRATVRNNWKEKLKDITEVLNRTSLRIHSYTLEEIITNHAISMK